MQEAMKNGDFLKLKPTQSGPFIVHELLNSNRLALWAQVPGKGKSLLATGMEYHIVYEAPFCDHPVTGGNVLVVDSENRLEILQDRAKKIRAGLERQGYSKRHDLYLQHYSGFMLDDKSTWAVMDADIRAIRPVLITFDHLARFHNQDENRSLPMAKVTMAIEDLMDIAGSSVLGLHHFGKTDTGSFYTKLRGSSAIYANTDVACEIRALAVRDGKLEKIGVIYQPSVLSQR